MIKIHFKKLSANKCKNQQKRNNNSSKLWVPRSNRGGITKIKPPTCSGVLFCVKSACEKNAGAFGRLVRRRRQAGASAPSESEQSRRDHQNKTSDLFGGFVLREIRL